MSNKQKDLIREVFLRNGFTIKDGRDDLADYVYAAAHDLLQALPAVQGEPVAWSLRFRHGDKYEHVGPINYMTAFGSKKDADIYANKVARDLDGNPEPERRPVVVPLYVAPPTEQQPAPDVTALVELLAEARDHVVSSTQPVRGGFIDEIDTALTTYRKEGEV